MTQWPDWATSHSTKAATGAQVQDISDGNALFAVHLEQQLGQRVAILQVVWVLYPGHLTILQDLSHNDAALLGFQHCVVVAGGMIHLDLATFQDHPLIWLISKNPIRPYWSYRCRLTAPQIPTVPHLLVQGFHKNSALAEALLGQSAFGLAALRLPGRRATGENHTDLLGALSLLDASHLAVAVVSWCLDVTRSVYSILRFSYVIYMCLCDFMLWYLMMVCPCVSLGLRASVICLSHQDFVAHSPQLLDGWC